MKHSRFLTVFMSKTGLLQTTGRRFLGMLLNKFASVLSITMLDNTDAGLLFCVFCKDSPPFYPKEKIWKKL